MNSIYNDVRYQKYRKGFKRLIAFYLIPIGPFLFMLLLTRAGIDSKCEVYTVILNIILVFAFISFNVQIYNNYKFLVINNIIKHTPKKWNILLILIIISNILMVLIEIFGSITLFGILFPIS